MYISNYCLQSVGQFCHASICSMHTFFVKRYIFEISVDHRSPIFTHCGLTPTPYGVLELVNTGWDNGFLTDGNKPLSKPSPWDHTEAGRTRVGWSNQQIQTCLYIIFIETVGTQFNEILFEIQIHENASENIGCKIGGIFSKPSYINSWGRVTHICVSN